MRKHRTFPYMFVKVSGFIFFLIPFLHIILDIATGQVELKSFLKMFVVMIVGLFACITYKKKPSVRKRKVQPHSVIRNTENHDTENHDTERKTGTSSNTTSTECIYPLDKTKPRGSKENPVVVGMPQYSRYLFYDEKNERWILTDGLGNGYIR